MITNFDKSCSKHDLSEGIVSEDIQINILGNLVKDVQLEGASDRTLSMDRLASDVKDAEGLKSTSLTNYQPQIFWVG